MGPARGFTLSELLVVVAVLSVLAGLLLPVLGRAKTKAQGAYCGNNIKQLALACWLYAEDFNDRLPYNVGTDQIKRWVAKDWFWNWTSPVMSWETESDNTNRALLTHGGIGGYAANTAEIYHCPSDRVVSAVQAELGWTRRVRSISMNAMIGNAGDYSQGGTNVNNPDYVQFFKTTQVSAPSRVFVFIEEHPDSINDGYFLNHIDDGSWTDLPASYHSGTANLSFADSHVESHKWLDSSTKPAAQPDAAHLPFPASDQRVDFDWLMQRTSHESQ